MDVELEDKTHFDLLHPSRRIWKLRLPSCDLQTLEKYILGKDRVGDIPGEIIPSLYFEFIRKRDAYLLQDVLEHNFYDIVNLILLAVKLSNVCENPEKHLEDFRDLFSLARFYFARAQYIEASSLLESLLRRNAVVDRELEIKAFFLLAMIHKKIGNSDISKKHLWELLNRQYFHPTVVEELAKFYEHQDKDYLVAKEIVERGLSYLNTVQELDNSKDVLKYLPQMKHRHERLIKKVEKTTDP
jgi:tetratricopeptide (TPR) repeat protein